MKAAVLCSRLLRNHPLPDGNKRVAYLCMIELIRRNGREWRPARTGAERAEMVERLAAREVSTRTRSPPGWARRSPSRSPARPRQPRAELAAALGQLGRFVDVEVDAEAGDAEREPVERVVAAAVLARARVAAASSVPHMPGKRARSSSAGACSVTRATWRCCAPRRFARDERAPGRRPAPRARRSACPSAPGAPAGRAGTCASPRARRPTRRGTSGARGSRASTARRAGGCPRRRAVCRGSARPRGRGRRSRAR